MGDHTILALLLTVLSIFVGCREEKPSPPNVILLMADDLGWGDVGFNGNDSILTPHLDGLAKEGIIFSRFYAAAPVCSPTRATCLTGRHHERYGIHYANSGHLKQEELTLQEILKEKGYLTGHFGKWHLGTLTTSEIDANRGKPGDSTHYAPPWEHGFDVCFSTESKVPTYDPMVTPPPTSGDIGKRKPGEHFGTYYWTGPGQKVTNNLDGDNSRVIMDRVMPFIDQATKKKQPFFVVIWFHTPHLPVLAGEEHRKMYAEYPDDVQHYYGAITAMDEQIGRLKKHLNKSGSFDNTIIFFTSDNGPEGRKKGGRTQGSTGGLRGRKRSLYEGGTRTPGFAVWPGKFKGDLTCDVPVVTTDYLPTILDILDISPSKTVLPLDGSSMLPFIKGETAKRVSPIFFSIRKQRAVVDDRYKLYSPDSGRTWELYDLIADPQEQTDISEKELQLVNEMKGRLDEWIVSVEKSSRGGDY